MQCKQIKKNGEQCKNHGAYGCKTCRYHGARRLISDLTGSPYHCLKKGIDSKGVEFVHNNPN